MCRETKWIKRTIAILFVIVLVLGFQKNRSLDAIESFVNYLMQQDDDEKDAISGIEKWFTFSMWKQEELIDFNGLLIFEDYMQIWGCMLRMEAILFQRRHIRQRIMRWNKPSLLEIIWRQMESS